MKTYTATGIVLGYLWDGTKATYPSQGVQADSHKRLVEII